MESLTRYSPIIDSWDRFVAAQASPLPTTFWMNSSRISSSKLATLLAAEGLRMEALPWVPDGFRLYGIEKPGNLWLYKAGLIHLMEEVSMIPPSLLDAREGDRILDLCAAPGNKTVLLASRLQGKGTVVANEFNWGRLAILRAHLERLGLTNVSTFHHNGTNLNGNFGAFDRILCDVPCSCEGTHRKLGKAVSWGHPDFRERLTSTQRALLRKALQLVKVGGRIVYSTCTYAPEENEAVIDAILKEYPGMMRVLPAHVPHFESRPGLRSWNGQDFDPQLENCLRAYPHLNDTGGFFVAVLEKIDTLPAWTSVAQIANSASMLDPQAQESLTMLSERFGMDSATFAPFGFYHKGGDLYATNPGHLLPLEPEPVSCGLMLLRKSINYPKMPSGLSNLLAPFATRNVIELDEQQRNEFMQRKKLELRPEQIQCCTEDGYVMLRYLGYGIGQGTFDRRTGAPMLHSLFPKGWVGPNPQ